MLRQRTTERRVEVETTIRPDRDRNTVTDLGTENASRTNRDAERYTET